MARILLVLQQQGNRRLLGEWLARHYEVVTAETIPVEYEPFDLAILDGPSLERLRHAVQARKQQEEPVFLPCVLLTPRQQASLITRHLWRTVDEMLLLPIDKVELRARVEVLLRVRQQSLELKYHHDELAAFLKARQALEETKNTFISTASHELRTPLTSIMGYVSLLLDGEVGTLSTMQQEFLHIVHNNTERLMTLVNDLLDISRIESGHMQLTLRVVDLADVLHQVVTELRTMAEEKHIRTVLPHFPDPMWVQADRDRLIQVLINLLSNAYKYSPPETTVTLRVNQQGHRVQIDIEDQGIGIAAPEQEQLFTKFFRTSAAKKQGVSGTGLGLSITRSLVELQGGQIWVESTPEAGSTFSFTIPFAHEGGTRTEV